MVILTRSSDTQQTFPSKVLASHGRTAAVDQRCRFPSTTVARACRHGLAALWRMIIVRLSMEYPCSAAPQH
jgi:hypothetical protein